MQKMYKIIIVLCLAFVASGAFAQENLETSEIDEFSRVEYIKGEVISADVSDVGDSMHRINVPDIGIITVDTYGELLPIGSTAFLEYYPDEEVYFFSTLDRNNYSILLLLIFIIAIIFLSGKKGIRSLLSLCVSFVLLFMVLIPLLLRGYDPIWLSLLFGLLVLFLSIFMTHGYNKQSLTSFIGSLFSIIFAAVILLFISHAAVITGLVSDHVQQLSFQVGNIINLSRLISAGIIIGILGVLDDITITQVAVVRELSSDGNLSRIQIFKKALRVGRDHISSLVNTLVFAYVGATLPMVMFITLLDIPFFILISQEFIFVEILRSLIGALALTLAVPVTTWLASFVFLNGIKQDNGSVESACAHHNH